MCCVVLCEDLNLCACFPHRCSCVPLVLLFLTVQTHTAAVQQTKAFEGKLMNLTTVEVVEGIHQTMVLKFGVLQMGSEMGLAVRNQTGQAGF